METVYLDTHAVVWLYQKDLDKFSSTVIELIENNDLLISPMALMELKFLNEIGRLHVKPMIIVSELQQTINLKICDEHFSKVVYESLDLSWTRDPFDRLIVANALASDAILLSKDRNIIQNYEKAIW